MPVFFKKTGDNPKVLLLYSNIKDVICAHSLLQKKGLAVSLVPPPPDVAIGCDLAVQLAPAEVEIFRSLVSGGMLLPGKLHYVSCAVNPVENLAQIAEIEPGYLMARANNIKVTIDESNNEIVNISGGGCPDIPLIAHQLIGRFLHNSPEPIDIGNTLCAYMVQLAMDALRREVKVC